MENSDISVKFDRIIKDFKSLNITELNEMQIHLMIRILNQKLDEIRSALTKIN